MELIDGKAKTERKDRAELIRELIYMGLGLPTNELEQQVQGLKEQIQIQGQLIGILIEKMDKIEIKMKKR